MPALQIGLNKPGGRLKGPSNPSLDRRKPIFGDDDDEDEDGGDNTSTPQRRRSGASKPDFEEISTFDETAPPKPSQSSQTHAKPASTSAARPTLKSKFPSQQHSANAPNLSALRTQIQYTADVDASIYDYDGAYDALHSKSSKSTASGKAASAQGASHMNDLLAAAEVRKRDQLRAKERLLQKEREAEGEEYKDKEMFVTEAYKAQQEEVKRAEEAERQREAEEAKRRDKGLGMTNFYRGFMEQEEKRHKEMVDAAASAAKKGGTGDDGVDAGEVAEKEKSEAEIARELKQQGKDVVVNDEGQLVDKRELLSAGLNVAAKPKAASDATKSDGGLGAAQRQGPQQGDPGRKDAHRAMRERQTRMMEAQLEQATKRNAEMEAEEREKVERAAKSQKTQGDISSARERYLQRKREAAAAAARGE